MIFVTVGTHEQPFDRLVEAIDKIKELNCIADEVIIQSGYCTYIPRFCEWKKLYSYKEMLQMVEKARIVITHGGPSSFMMPLQMGKIPIVVPRKKEFDEHVNNHQVDFCEAVVRNYNNIILVDEIEMLQQTILEYEKIKERMTCGLINNNQNFCDEFSKQVVALFERG